MNQYWQRLRTFWPAHRGGIDRTCEFCVETLEDRQLLAGTVQVTLRGTRLDIAGDDQANQIVVREVGNFWRVTAGDLTTVVEGDTLVAKPQRLNINLQGGDDHLSVINVVAAAATQIDTGAGNDQIAISNSTLGALVLLDEQGQTNLTIVDSQVANSSQITNRAGALAADLRGVQLGGSLVTRVSGGEDQLRLDTQSVIAGNLTRFTRLGDQSTDVVGGSRVDGTLRAVVDAGFDADVNVAPDATVGRLIAPSPTLLRNEVYATPDGIPLRADVYIPRSSGPHPAVLLIHGGYWRFGDKANMAAQAKYLVDRGYTVVSINYRLAPMSTFPAPVHDAKQAVRWMRDHATRLQIDPDRIAAYGYSAGAQLALLLGVTSRADGLDGPGVGNTDTSSAVQAVIAGGAPADFQDRPADSNELAYYFGGTPAEVPEAYRNGSPIYWVSRGDAPTMFYFGGWDTVVNRANAERMHVRLQQAGVSSEFHVLSRATHVSAAADPRALEFVARFLATQLS